MQAPNRSLISSTSQLPNVQAVQRFRKKPASSAKETSKTINHAPKPFLDISLPKISNTKCATQCKNFGLCKVECRTVIAQNVTTRRSAQSAKKGACSLVRDVLKLAPRVLVIIWRQKENASNAETKIVSNVLKILQDVSCATYHS